MLLLIYDPDDPGEPEAAARRPSRRRRLPAPPWRPCAWIAAFCWLLFAAGEIGGLTGYVILLAAIGLGCWRLDRWLGGLYWGGLREIQR